MKRGHAPEPLGLRSPGSRISASSNQARSLRKTISIGSFPQPPTGVRPTQLSSPLAGIDVRRNSAHTLRMSQPLLSPKSPMARIDHRAADSRCSSSSDSYSPNISDGESNTTIGSSAPDSKLGDDGAGNVIVSVRVRPNGPGSDNSSLQDWELNESSITYKGKLSNIPCGTFGTDHVFRSTDNNKTVYNRAAKQLVERVLEGYHGTIFAYGMTGTGKTFSMQGTDNSPGVIPLAVADLFKPLHDPNCPREYLFRVHYLEIYNEKIHDLLADPHPTGPGTQTFQQEEIKLQADPRRGMAATPVQEKIVHSGLDLLDVIAKGDQNRKVAGTQYNANSSRSHAIIQILVESRVRPPGTKGPALKELESSGPPPSGVRVSTLSLIDLAGSEKAAEDKNRRTEGIHINKSLLTLSTVISRLSEANDKKGLDKDKHVPFRDSKLTQLLRPALSGDSLVSILCTISIPSAGTGASITTHVNETMNTLRFAVRAKNNIVSHAQKSDETLGLIDSASREQFRELSKENRELKEKNQNLLNELAKMRREIREMKENVHAANVTVAQTLNAHSTIKATHDALRRSKENYMAALSGNRPLSPGGHSLLSQCLDVVNNTDCHSIEEDHSDNETTGSTRQPCRKRIALLTRCVQALAGQVAIYESRKSSECLPIDLSGHSTSEAVSRLSQIVQVKDAQLTLAELQTDHYKTMSDCRRELLDLFIKAHNERKGSADQIMFPEPWAQRRLSQSSTATPPYHHRSPPAHSPAAPQSPQTANRPSQFRGVVNASRSLEDAIYRSKDNLHMPVSTRDVGVARI